MATVLEIVSPNTRYSDKYIEADYKYDSTIVKKEKGVLKVLPRTTRLTFRTARHVPKLGVMLVGWGGNNGSTATAAVLANRNHLSWHTKDGIKKPNYFGSLLQAGTTCIGTSEAGDEVHLPFRDLLPTVHPDDLVFGGWDISAADLAQAMERAKVIDYDLQRQLKPLMEGLKPLPAIYDKDFIAANQEDRADNVIRGTKWEQVSQIRHDIRDFRDRHQVEKVIILWTANTERFCELKEGLNDTSATLLSSIKAGQSEISPSTLYAVASILEDCAFINGSPQNTFVPGLVELAEKNNVLIGGDDFKSGQTKFKSVLVDFLVGAGIKPVAIASYNHLGNNDGKNLSAAKQFRSKEISKSNVVDDMVASNPVLYAPGEKIDHCVVIKYMPYVGDSKRALDEYTSEIMMNGKNTIVVHNTCEDSFLAVPLILDLVVLTELCQRISFRVLSDAEATTYQSFNSILSILSYLCKAPLVPRGAPVINALNTQRCCIENLFRGCLGLPPVNHLGLEHKLSNPKAWCTEQQEKVRDSSVLVHQEQLNGFVKGKAVIVEGFVCNGVENGYH